MFSAETGWGTIGFVCSFLQSSHKQERLLGNRINVEKETLLILQSQIQEGYQCTSTVTNQATQDSGHKKLVAI